jgi:hypothetical protein
MTKSRLGSPTSPIESTNIEDPQFDDEIVWSLKLPWILVFDMNLDNIIQNIPLDEFVLEAILDINIHSLIDNKNGCIHEISIIQRYFEKYKIDVYFEKVQYSMDWTIYIELKS